jgi:hypothetical protein
VLIRGLRPAQQAIELAAHDVHVDGHARVLHGQEPDAQRALHEQRSVRLLPLGDERGQAGVDQRDVLDRQAFTVDRHGGKVARRRQGDQVAGGFHGATIRGVRAT